MHNLNEWQALEEWVRKFAHKRHIDCLKFQKQIDTNSLTIASEVPNFRAHAKLILVAWLWNLLSGECAEETRENEEFAKVFLSASVSFRVYKSQDLIELIYGNATNARDQLVVDLAHDAYILSSIGTKKLKQYEKTLGRSLSKESAQKIIARGEKLLSLSRTCRTEIGRKFANTIDREMQKYLESLIIQCT